MTLLVNFKDFWPGFNPEDNYFLDLLRKSHTVELAGNPDVLFFSVFGESHRTHDCVKIQYVGENVRFNRFLADYFIGFDPAAGERAIRWPLYKLYGNPYDLPASCGFRDKFCCTVVSNPNGRVRNAFFEALSSRKRIDSGGRYRNNVGGPVESKLEFLRGYRFSMAFEHSSYPGYTTEKILEAKQAGTVPIYWGNPQVCQDFQPGSFINLHDFERIADCVDYVLAVDADPVLFGRMRDTPLVASGAPGRLADQAELETWLLDVLQRKKKYFRSPILARCVARMNRKRTERFNEAAAARFVAASGFRGI